MNSHRTKSPSYLPRLFCDSRSLSVVLTEQLVGEGWEHWVLTLAIFTLVALSPKVAAKM